MHTLLVADDSVTIQRVVELIFAGKDVRVVAVGDGDQAIQRLDAAPPDIVLADIGMPGKNGYEVARYVKESPRLSHIPVVLLSGAFEPVDERRAEEAGCDGVLAKPFEPQLVVSRVEQLLAGPPAATGARDEALAAPPNSPSSSAPLPRFEQPPSGEMPVRAGELDEYFDRLGAAFAERLRSGTQAKPQGIASSSGVPSPSSVTTDTRDSAAPESTSTRPAETVPTLADRFAALLAAEQGGRPVNVSTDAPAVTAVSNDEIVEQVSRRVLAQLTDRVVRETVADMVSQVAERLVREEIERIKAAIK